jgi:hypothetical protein
MKTMTASQEVLVVLLVEAVAEAKACLVVQVFQIQ